MTGIHKQSKSRERTLQLQWEIQERNNEKADYGSRLLDMIAKDLRKKNSKGFSRSNVFNFRRFYLAYPKIQAVPGFLS